MPTSKSHYNTAAAAFKRRKDQIDEDEATSTITAAEAASMRVTLRDIAGDLADLYAAENSRFDYTRFLTACGF